MTPPSSPGWRRSRRGRSPRRGRRRRSCRQPSPLPATPPRRPRRLPHPPATPPTAPPATPPDRASRHAARPDAAPGPRHRPGLPVLRPAAVARRGAQRRQRGRAGDPDRDRPAGVPEVLVATPALAAGATARSSPSVPTGRWPTPPSARTRAARWPRTTRRTTAALGPRRHQRPLPLSVRRGRRTAAPPRRGRPVERARPMRQSGQ